MRSNEQQSRRAVGYVRVSTEDQAREGVSLEAQQAKIRAWCEANDYELVAIHEDAGLSAKRADNRPGLQAALEQTCQERAALVAYSISRLSRSTRDMLAIAERLQQSDADLVSLTERIDTTSAAGRMIFGVLSVLAQFERELIGERTRDAMAHKARKGEAVGRAPRGMRIENGRLSPDPSSDGLALAQRARELRAEGLTLQAIADQLDAEGFRPERGSRLRASTIHYVLRNHHLSAHSAA